MDPQGFIALAQQLAAGNPSEAALRTAVERAYYGAFLALRDVMVVKGWVPEHRTIRDPLDLVTTLRSRPGYRFLSDLLDELRMLRNRADYELQRPFGLEEARRAITLAQELLQRLPAGR